MSMNQAGQAPSYLKKDPHLESPGTDYQSIAESFIRITTMLMVILTLFGAFYAGLFPIRGDNDSWWHLKSGKVIWDHMLEHGLSLPEYDPFTYTGVDEPWVNHEWLSELIFWWAFLLGGLQGAIVLKSLLLTAMIGLFLYYMHRNGVGWKMACLGAMLALLASQGMLELRPVVFTYLFIVIFLHLILSLQLGESFKWSVIGLIVCEILWINLHGGGVIGILLVSFWWLSELWFCLITWLKENPTAPSFKRFWTSSWVLLGVTLASLINPFGYEIHFLPSKVMNDWFLLQNIGELQSPNMHYYKPFEIIILGLFLLPMMRAGSIWIYEGLAIVFFGHQALNYVRHVPLFALVAVPPIISAFAEERNAMMPTGIPQRSPNTIWARLCNGVRWAMSHHLDVIIAFLIFAFLFGIRPGKIWWRNYKNFNHLEELGYIPEMYPENAVNYLLRHDIQGPMFNHDNFAGYLIWRLAPEIMKLFTDSRYDMWGSVYAKEELAVFGARKYPLGAYDIDGRWHEFENPNLIDAIMQSPGDLQFFPELREWKEYGGPDKSYWQYVLDKYNANFIISYEGYPIDRFLRSDFYGWYLIYDDMLMFNRGGYVIYLRGTPENMPNIRELTRLPLHREQIPPVEP